MGPLSSIVYRVNYVLRSYDRGWSFGQKAGNNLHKNVSWYFFRENVQIQLLRPVYCLVFLKIFAHKLNNPNCTSRCLGINSFWKAFFFLWNPLNFWTSKKIYWYLMSNILIFDVKIKLVNSNNARCLRSRHSRRSGDSTGSLAQIPLLFRAIFIPTWWRARARKTQRNASKPIPYWTYRAVLVRESPRQRPRSNLPQNLLRACYVIRHALWWNRASNGWFLNSTRSSRIRRHGEWGTIGVPAAFRDALRRSLPMGSNRVYPLLQKWNCRRTQNVYLMSS